MLPDGALFLPVIPDRIILVKDNKTTVVENVTEEETEEPEVEIEKLEKKSNSGMFVIVLLVIGGAAGGYFYITKSKNKKPAKSDVDPDMDYKCEDTP